MKRISAYQKLLGVPEKADLKTLKTAYRNIMKECHPDKFQEGAELDAAQEKSKRVIEAYHFLVSVSAETHAANAEAYNAILTSCIIVDFVYKQNNLQITFDGGTIYEYFDVPRSVYIKFVNADTPNRFVRRHICGSYTYRELSKAAVA